MKTENRITFSRANVKNITSPAARSSDRRIYRGTVRVEDVINISNGYNIRDFLGLKGSVQNDILDTLNNRPEDFEYLNGGISIVANDLVIDHDKVTIINPSIINGAQTQGVIVTALKASIEDFKDVYVQVEIAVTKDKDLITEMTISRNNQCKVQAYSILNRRGVFDDLEKAMKEAGVELNVCESDDKNLDNVVQLIKVLVIMTPQELLDVIGIQNKTFAYSCKAKCLELYQKVADGADTDDKFKSIYKCWLSIAPDALRLYDAWKKHQGFYGTRIQNIDRGNNGNIENVPDGIIFPILASLSKLVKRTERGPHAGHCSIEYDGRYDTFLINAAVMQYKDNGSNPSAMGKNTKAYTNVENIIDVVMAMAK